MHERRENEDRNQFSMPVGDEGRDVLRDMNEHHRGLMEWALTVIPEIQAKRILDIGCGGGMLISLLASQYPDSEIDGIDISADAVDVASSLNSNLIENGRCRISVASVSDLPFDDGTFDLITAFETYFFWPDLGNDIMEASRTMAAGGVLVIVSETYHHPDFRERNDRLIEEYGMNILRNEELAELMENAGMIVETVEIEDLNWIAFIGRKISVS